MGDYYVSLEDVHILSTRELARFLACAGAVGMAIGWIVATGIMLIAAHRG